METTKDQASKVSKKPILGPKSTAINNGAVIGLLIGVISTLPLLYVFHNICFWAFDTGLIVPIQNKEEMCGYTVIFCLLPMPVTCVLAGMIGGRIGFSKGKPKLGAVIGSLLIQMVNFALMLLSAATYGYS